MVSSTSTLSIDSTVTLNNGVKMPRLGLGVWQSAPGGEAQQAVELALAAGYRHIDTARIYENERDVGRAVARSAVARGEVFVTTKLWNDDHGYEPALRAFDASLERLGFDYVDLYLVHWPVQGARAETWRAMERILESGRARAIGVSNYLEHHLDELDGYAEVVPAVDQFELHPFLYRSRRNSVDACRRRGIAIESYSPLAKGSRFDHPVVQQTAAAHDKSPAQVLIRWALQHDVIVIPKSVREHRIRENADVFDFALDGEEMQMLDALDERMVTAWDPMDMP